MSDTPGKYTLGTHRGPLALDENDARELEKLESAGGLTLSRASTRGEKLRQHWKRFWFIYLVGNIIFLAIFLPIFFLIAIPAIAQMVVNKSTLLLVSGAVLQPKPDSVQLTMKASIDLKVAVPVRIEAVTFDLFQPDLGHDRPYAALDLPGQTIKGNYTLGVSDRFTPIQDTEAWVEFVRQVVFQEKTSLSLYAPTTAYLGVLKSNVIMNKAIVTPGLNKFKGLAISDATLLLPPEDDGTNLVGNITLPNPSVLELEVGTLQMDVKSGDLTVGNASLTDITLKPGDNTFPMNGVLDLKKVITNLGDVIKSQAPYLKKGKLSLNAVATSIVWDGTEVPYYTKVLRELTLPVEVAIGDILKNSLRELLHGNGDLVESLKEGMGRRSIGDGTDELAAFLKQNEDVMDTFPDIDPARRDEIIDSLAAMYGKL
ncbi:hypothetical protein BDW42DRAFT_198335 [Aspergillus taichungensis]|uniref:Uncharacterized protein n=1 Tax=Aspergillus taichungensis TaxID=482145 RepID=A0A2J5I9W0_9EURO|nr:hypothetical protein BDW42DRAFT_198335 [Aspergillus taichungensis]